MYTGRCCPDCGSNARICFFHFHCRQFGWMQELDGDPGAVSQWYRKQNVNLKDVTNNFNSLGLSFFVYTNVDNC